MNDDIWQGVSREFCSTDKVTKATVENAEKLLRLIDGRSEMPTRAFDGWFPTIIFYWESAEVEVEVFEDTYELYFFAEHESEASSFSVREFPSSDPKAVEELLAELIAALPAGGS